MNRHLIPNEDTIAAIATPPGNGSIAIIRISGPKSSYILELIFRPGRGNVKGRALDPHRLYHGHIFNPSTNDIADEVLCVLMRSPNSYTGAAVVEIHSHAGHLVPKRILEILFGLGIRPANPGEFSLRAFLNGKMDLTQAEAVSDIINARTEEGLKQAELQHEGVRLAKKKAEEAELLLIVLDGSEALDIDDIEVLQGAAGRRAIFILNKSDIGIKFTPEALPSVIHKSRIVHTSAKLGTGTEELKDAMRGLLTSGNAHTDGSEIILTELRHKLALEKAANGLTSFLKLLEKGDSPEFLAIELRAALNSLGEITGEVTTEDILGRIFSKFCIGK